MGVRQIDRFLEQWQMDAKDLASADDSGADAQGAGEDGTPCWLLAQGLTAAGTAAEGLGKGSPHYWPLGRRPSAREDLRP